jgi:hypothetical protein
LGFAASSLNPDRAVRFAGWYRRRGTEVQGAGLKLGHYHLLFCLGFDGIVATCWAERHLAQHANAFIQ